MRTFGLSHQIMGPTTVKVAKTGLMRKIANLQLEVPYFNMIYQIISIIITFITQASLMYLQELGTFLAPQNRAQGRCVTFSQEALVKGCRTLGQDFSIELLSQPKIQMF